MKIRFKCDSPAQQTLRPRVIAALAGLKRSALHALPLVTLLALTLHSPAFPPAPNHIFYGMVRDEMGNPLNVGKAEVILEAPNGKPIRAFVAHGLEPGVNYRLAVPMDAGATSDIYRNTALRANMPFKIRVQIGQTVYLPIEMSGEFRKLGGPAQLTRLDLTLGEDSDGDGLPDAWERAILAQMGGTITDFKPGDDADGDGKSNLDEYLAGTHAFDHNDGLSLRVLELSREGPVLEFMAIRGRSYSIQGSDDLQQWITGSFRLGSEASGTQPRKVYQAGETGVVRIKPDASGGPGSMRFFKLKVQ